MNYNELIRRDLYIEKLLSFAANDNLSFVVGVRRAGKSSIAFQLEKELKNHCSDHEAVIRINFETTGAVRMSSESLIAYVEEKCVNIKKCFLILDEVRHVKEFENAINFFTKNIDCKLFIISSSRRVISEKITAVKEGKFEVVEALPLSLPEFILLQSFEEITPESTPLLEKRYRYLSGKTYTIKEIYKIYITYGGLPVMKPEYMNIERARVITDGSYGAIVTRDILEIGAGEGIPAVTDPVLLRSVISIMAKSIGDNISATWIGKQTAEVLQRPSATKTIESYIRALVNAHLFYVAERYDIRSEQRLKTLAKYYIVDASLHNYVTVNSPEDESRLLENKVFFELLRRGYAVCNGKIGKEGVHLVAKDNFGKFYVQVVNELNEENMEEILSPLRKIRDNHPKIVIVFNGKSSITEDGIIILNALEFLMGYPLKR